MQWHFLRRAAFEATLETVRLDSGAPRTPERERATLVFSGRFEIGAPRDRVAPLAPDGLCL